MNEITNKIFKHLKEIKEDLKNDDSLQKISEEVRTKGAKAWGALQSSTDKVLEAIKEAPFENWSEIAKGIVQGKILIPSEKIKEILEEKILAKKKNISSIRIHFEPNKIKVNFEQTGIALVKGSFSLSLHQINIAKNKQSISFKVENPLQLNLGDMPEETIAMLSSLLGKSLKNPGALDAFVPEDLQNITQKGNIWHIDLSQLKEFEEWKNNSFFGKNILEYINITNAEIQPEYIVIYPKLA